MRFSFGKFQVMIIQTFRQRPRHFTMPTRILSSPTALLRFLVAILLGLGTLNVSAAVSLEPQTLRYSVTYNNQNAGELEVIISRDHSGYQITAISHLSMLAKMFLESTTVTSRFEAFNDTFRLVSGKEIADDTNEVRRGFTVDHTSSKINFTKSDPLSFDPAVRMDADAFPLLLVLENGQVDTGNQLLSVSPKRGRLYEYNNGVEESVSVPAGDFQTSLIIASRKDDSGKSIRYWLRRNDRIPVKITTGKPGNETTLELLP